jgi:hypothetical protein
MGGPITISDIDATIVSFGYKDVSGEDYKASVLVYDAAKDLKRAELTLSTTDITGLDVINVQVTYSVNGGTPTTSSLRLMLNIDSAEVTANDP